MSKNLTEKNELIELLTMPVCTIGPNRRVLEFNSAAKDAFPTMSGGQNIAFFLREPAFLQACDEAIKSGENAEVEIEELGPPKRYFKVQLRAYNTNHVMLIFTDVTLAMEGEKTRTNFVANVSHELRSPLTTLMGCIETLLGPAANDPKGQAKFLGLMEQEANRMKRIVDDLLSLAKTETTSHMPPNNDVDLVEVISRTTNVLENQASKKNMNFVTGVSLDQAVVKGDRDQLIQVMHNLVDNAIKYGLEGGEINIHMVAEGDKYIISVSNMGVTIPSEKLSRLTERFYRVDNSRSRDVGGTGLGLSIVKHIINRHRGGLDINLTPQGKITFTISMPID